MNRCLLSALMLLSVSTLVLTTGCPSPEPPENAITWGIKAATGKLTQTTPGEWQALADKVDELTPETAIPDLTDEQAAAIVDFIRANELDSIQQITALVEQAQADPSIVTTLEIPESMMELFGEIDFNAISGDILADIAAD